MDRKFSFFDLPAEIRVMVYEFLLAYRPFRLDAYTIRQSGVIESESFQLKIIRKGPFLRAQPLSVDVLQTCSRVYHEALPVLYGLNQFWMVCLWIRRLNDPSPFCPELVLNKAGLIRRLGTRYSFSLEYLKAFLANFPQLQYFGDFSEWHLTFSEWRLTYSTRIDLVRQAVPGLIADHPSLCRVAVLGSEEARIFPSIREVEFRDFTSYATRMVLLAANERVSAPVSDPFELLASC